MSAHQQPTKIWEGELQTRSWVTATFRCLHSSSSSFPLGEEEKAS